MPSTSSTALLIEAPAGRHFAQLHKDPQALADAVGIFVETGLLRGDAVIIIAPTSRIPLYLQHLQRSDKTPEIWQKSGQLTVLDGPMLMGRFMKGNMPEWEDFRETVGPIIEGTSAFNRKGTRVYGEMVSDLWRAGNTAAAIRLEEYWNELARLYQFCLFCGYELDSMDEASYRDPLDEIGRTHSDILTTEEDDRLWAALDAAGKEVLGVPLAEMLSCSGCEGDAGEHRLSRGHQTMLWLQRNMPDAMTSVLKRAREIYAEEINPSLSPPRLSASASSGRKSYK